MYVKVIKSVKYKIIISCIFFIAIFMFLKDVEKYELVESIQVVFNCLPLEKFILIMVFFVYVFLLQFINIDIYRVVCRKSGLFFSRFQSRDNLFLFLMKCTIIINSLYVLAIIVGAIVVYKIDFLEMKVHMHEVVALYFYGLLLSAFFSLIQIIFLNLYDEEKAFVGELIITAMSSVISRISARRLLANGSHNGIIVDHKWLIMIIVGFLCIYVRRIIKNDERM